MANSLLNKSKHFIGEAIKGSFVITVDEEDPAIPEIDVLNASLQFIVKKSYDDADSDALVNLTIGDGITVISNTSVLYTCTYEIPGSATQNLSTTGRDTIVELVYEINCTYDGESDSDVLETGILKMDTKRVKTTF
jgi:hypothetical protein